VIFYKLSHYYAREYDLVAVEDLELKGMLESPGNSRNTASTAWSSFTDLLEYKCKCEGAHFVEVDPKNTTKEYASCGVKTDKPLWVGEHSCPACEFKTDRNANAAWNIFSRTHRSRNRSLRSHVLRNACVSGLRTRALLLSTPVETALPVDTDSVSAKRVVETGGPITRTEGSD